MNFIEKLQAKLKEKGLPEFIAALVKVESDSDVDNVINAFEGIKDSASSEFTTALSGLTQKQADREADRRVSNAIKTHEKTLREKYNLVEKQSGNPQPRTQGNEGGDDSGITELKNTVIELQQTIKALSEKQSKDSIRNTFLSKAKEKQIPEEWALKYSVENPEKMDEVLGTAEKEYTDFRQKLLIEHYGGELPRRGGEPLTDSLITNYATGKNTAGGDSGVPAKEL